MRPLTGTVDAKKLHQFRVVLSRRLQFSRRRKMSP
jgi:hypothetical protein